MHSFAQMRDTALLLLFVAALFLAAEVFYYRTPASCYVPPAAPAITRSAADQATLSPTARGK